MPRICSLFYWNTTCVTMRHSLAKQSWSSFRTAYMLHILGCSTRMIFTETGQATSLQYFLHSKSLPVNPCQNRVISFKLRTETEHCATLKEHQKKKSHWQTNLLTHICTTLQYRRRHITTNPVMFKLLLLSPIFKRLTQNWVPVFSKS